MDPKTDKQADAGQRVPWWRVRMMWLIVGGPLAVVVAAIVTAVIAIRGADVVIGSGAAPQSRQPADDVSAGDMRPAIEARNKAAAEAATAGASSGQR
jgi:hypothetical protein